ncbi:thioredoxin family protein [Flavobacteriaceae bacterium]|nr:thioredoxin family protein [Flavobacteriaceae bacterium]MDA9572119.1 thioredoxin family protein [Flavobacteriaceae bacterium]
MKTWMLFLLGIFYLQAQIEEPVVWEKSLEQLSEDRYLLKFEAQIAPKWHLYSQFSNPDGAIPTEFVFDDLEGYQLIGTVEESESITDFDQVFEMDLTYFKERATFQQEIQITNSDINQVKVEINYQACDDELCIFRTETVALALDGSITALELEIDEKSQRLSQALKLELSGTQYLESNTEKEGTYAPWNIFLLGFFGGLLALLTPCVFPMIPLTVSFFLKQSTTKAKGIFNALLYAFFIVLIYVLLSLPFHFIDSLNPEILNNLATNVTLNMLFFVVFVFFAFSFFGFYELTLPTGWGSKTDQASAVRGGFGIFFMALTLAIVSFSCTGPILGSLLAGSLTAEGGAFQLSIGMLGFGVALGLPFGLFALFPNTLKALPKSGGWMTTVKVVLGFLELALALKFLSNADLVAHWGILKREVFIGIWTLLAFGLTLYLFGIFRFPNEVKMPLSRGRKLMAVGTLILTSYLFLGFISEENKLRLFSGFPPPEFYSLRAQESDCPIGLDCYKDFEEGQKAARVQNKPILLDFTGWACVNCRRMEENVWAAPEVYKLLKERYIIISLYVDDREALSAEGQFNYQYADGRSKEINTVGKKWATFQAINFNTASQPFYVQLTAEGQLLNTPIQYTDKATFEKWLLQGLERVTKAPAKAQYFNF